MSHLIRDYLCTGLLHWLLPKAEAGEMQMPEKKEWESRWQWSPAEPRLVQSFDRGSSEQL